MNRLLRPLSRCLSRCLPGWLPAAAAALGLSAGMVWAQTPPAATLQLQVVAAGRPLVMNRLGALADRQRRGLAVSRLDLLLSGLSLQRPDGSWTSAEGWHAFFRAEQPLRLQALPPIPPGEYVAARFDVGVDPAANHADPNRLGPNDPLHPLINDLHWGWAGGYVFVALEGHWPYDRAAAGQTGGYSYHLAGDDNLVRVTLPVRLKLPPGARLRLTLDATALLRKVDVVRDGDSTHSRSQDPIVRAMKDALRQAWRLQVLGATAASGVPGASGAVAAGPGGSNAAAQPYPWVVGAHLPSVTLPPDNRLTLAGVELGRRLFNDPRLSRDGSVSCASCHRTGHALADGGKALSAGIAGLLGTRNAMPLFNLAWVSEFFWDGRVKRLRDQVLQPIQHPREMGETLPRVVAKLAADRNMQAAFAAAFHGPVNADRIGLALEQFLLTQVSQDSRFDRVMKGAEQFTPSEKRGFELFLTEHDPAKGLRGADCFHCHGGNLFTQNRFTNNGLAPAGGDLGREAVTHDAADRGKFRIPSLRNVALTGPYMHDGRFKTLEEVVEHYDHGVQRSATLDPNLAKHPPEGLRLSSADKAALVAFLRTLSDPAFAPPAPVAPRTKP